MTTVEKKSDHSSTKYEPLLNDTSRRFCLMPIKYPKLFAEYKKLVSTFWVAEEIDLELDVIHFQQKLNDDERFYLSMVLAFFASADAMVNLNLLNFATEVCVPECQMFYAFQACQENIHSEVYGLLIDRLVQEQEKPKLFNALKEIDSIKEKGEWVLQWANPDKSFATRIVAWACVEGLLFASSFAAIAYFKHRQLLPGVGTANEYISRDESLHCDFGCLLYRDYIQNKLSPDTIYQIIEDAVQIEDRFVRESLPVRLIGLNADAMCTYVRYTADRLMDALGIKPKYNIKKNPFPWISLLSVHGQTSFFEKKVSDYAISTLQKSNIAFDAEF